MCERATHAREASYTTIYVLMVHTYMHGLGLKILQGESPLVPSESPLPPAATETGTRAGLSVCLSVCCLSVCLTHAQTDTHTPQAIRSQVMFKMRQRGCRCVYVCMFIQKRACVYRYISVAGAYLPTDMRTETYIATWISTGCTTHAVRLGASVGG